ncbi:hypothetical protein LSH36_95g06003 [Paralvinella palmiformis]|uniref:Uncharacterized protein n=1 Tax=Paralvinella palmiformis TaxID=53620 RepID=A0AAD9NCX9_9ANNE|nr:hypothetical protein LSH36_95g06003 [Paralvinella palmiformis]
MMTVMGVCHLIKRGAAEDDSEDESSKRHDPSVPPLEVFDNNGLQSLQLLQYSLGGRPQHFQSQRTCCAIDLYCRSWMNVT